MLATALVTAWSMQARYLAAKARFRLSSGSHTARAAYCSRTYNAVAPAILERSRSANRTTYCFAPPLTRWSFEAPAAVALPAPKPKATTAPIAIARTAKVIDMFISISLRSDGWFDGANVYRDGDCLNRAK